MHRPLSRRHLLRGLGVSLALPYLDAMRAPSQAADSTFKPWPKSNVVQPRIICCYIPNGVNIEEWVPKDTGVNYQLSPTLKVLEDLRNEFTVISGLGHPRAQGGHSGADTWLTGADLKSKPGADYSNGLSADQLVASVHGKLTRFPSLQLSDSSGTGAAGHSHTLSFDRNGTPLPAENSPSRLFERLFVPDSAGDRTATLKRYAERRSILDEIASESKALDRRLGGSDRQKLEEYLSSVRETETQVEHLQRWVDVRKPKVPQTDLLLSSQPLNAHDRAMWLDVMLDLTYLAFVTDLTRVITFEWSREAGGFGGAGENHHELSHHGGDPGMLSKLGTIDRFHLSKLKRLMSLLKFTREGPGSMLDNTMLLFGSGMNSGAGGEHSPQNLPLLVAGGAKLGLKHNQHLAFKPDRQPPLNNVLLALIQRMGLPANTFGDSTGSLTGMEI